MSSPRERTVLFRLLFGFSQIDSFVFKGGTALSKIYFPEIWRLSEDLDFSLLDDNFVIISESIEEIFKLAEKKSGIKFILKNKYSNPDYLQLKIQYHGVISRNWIKADFMKNDIVDKPLKKSLKKEYSDFEDVKIKIESLEKISPKMGHSLGSNRTESLVCGRLAQLGERSVRKCLHGLTIKSFIFRHISVIPTNYA